MQKFDFHNTLRKISGSTIVAEYLNIAQDNQKREDCTVGSWCFAEGRQTRAQNVIKFILFLDDKNDLSPKKPTFAAL